MRTSQVNFSVCPTADIGWMGKKEFVERVAAIFEVKLNDVFCEAGRLPPDLRGDIKAVVTLY